MGHAHEPGRRRSGGGPREPAHAHRGGARPHDAHGANGHAGSHGHRRDRHGNPEDFEAYLARLQDPERIAWQRPDDVVAALGLRPGGVACDVGAGPGLFAIPLARAVGPSGRVHAIDVEPRMLEVLERRAAEAGLSNVHAILAPGDTVEPPPEPCDAILAVNVFHHFPDGTGALRALASRLAPGGVLANVDFHPGELPVGPSPEHKVSREAFVAAAARAGLEVIREETFLPYQYFLVLRPR